MSCKFALYSEVATMSDYIFEGHEQDDELVRLRMIEELFDPTTIGHLERTGIGAGWHCLELGAGGGSIMKWLGATVGSTGRVLGVDKSANHLHNLAKAPIQVVDGDFMDISPDIPFDLAHCRYVLIHNRTGDEMLRKLCNALKPGGFLVVEEPDFTSAKLLNKNTDDAQKKVNNAVCRLFEEMGLDPSYGLSLPKKVTAEGLEIIEVDSRLHLARGGSLMARMMGMSEKALAEKYVATGEATYADIERSIANNQDDDFWTVHYATVSVVARCSRTNNDKETFS